MCCCCFLLFSSLFLIAQTCDKASSAKNHNYAQLSNWVKTETPLSMMVEESFEKVEESLRKLKKVEESLRKLKKVEERLRNLKNMKESLSVFNFLQLLSNKALKRKSRACPRGCRAAIQKYPRRLDHLGLSIRGRK